LFVQLNFKNIRSFFLVIAILATYACSNDEARSPVINSNDFTQKITLGNAHLDKSPLVTQHLFPLADLVENVQQSVVSISVDIVSRGRFFDFTDEGSGTGIIISNDGYIVTNYHVIQNTSDIEVSISDGRNYSAEIVGLDVLTDLAVIKIEADNLSTIKFGESRALRPGDWVFTIGNALGLRGGPSVTFGIISGVGRTVQTERGDLYDMIQTDAAINQGNSGGPLVNDEGEVIGINTAVYSGAQGIGFSVSSSVAQPVINSLIKEGKVTRPLIGLRGMNTTSTISKRYDLGVAEGIFVTQISPNGPADNGKLKVGDVITAINGTPTPTMSEFLPLLWGYDVGDVVTVTYISEKSPLVTEIILDVRP
jgi:serine protease Do